MFLSAYVAGWFVVSIGVLIAVTKIPACHEVGVRRVALIAVAAGALWPVLIVGVAQLLLIAGVAKACAGGGDGLTEEQKQLRSLIS